MQSGSTNRVGSLFVVLLRKLWAPGLATTVTFWILSTWPPENPILPFLAYYAVIPLVWVVATLNWEPVSNWLSAKWHESSKGGLLATAMVLAFVWVVLLINLRPIAPPYEFNYHVTPDPYPTGSKLFGMDWNPNEVDMRIYFTNASDVDFFGYGPAN